MKVLGIMSKRQNPSRSSEILCGVGEDGNIQTVNRALDALLGYHPGELIGVPVETIFDSGPGIAALRQLWSADPGEAAGFQDVRTHLKRKDGRPIEVVLSASVLRGEAGAPVSVMCVGRVRVSEEGDVRALLQERDFISAILDSTNALVMVVDRQGRIVRFNRTCERASGYTFEEVAGRYVWDVLFPPGELERVKSVFEAVTAARVPREKQVTWLTKDGQRLQIAWSNALLLEEDGSVGYVVGTGIDITEHQQVGMALRRYAEEQSVLYSVASATAALLDVEDLSCAVLDVMLPFLQASVGWVIIPDGEGCRVVASQGVPRDLLESSVTPTIVHCPLCTHRDADAKPAVLRECPQMPQALRAALGVQGHICIPLLAGEEVLGALSVAWTAPAAGFDVEIEPSLLKVIGQQVGLALRNCHLYQAALQVNRLQLLNDLEGALAATLDPDEVIEITMRHTADVLNASRGFLLSRSTTGHGDPGRIFILNRGWVEASHAGQEARTIFGMWETWRSCREIAVFEPSQPTAWDGALVVPICDDYDEDWIALIVVRRPQGQPFTDEERMMARAIATRAGQAIRNAQLYRNSQEHLTRLAMLNEISAATVSSLELDVVLRQVLDLTCAALNATSASIMLSKADTNELFFVPALASDNRLQVQHVVPGQGIAGWVAEHGEPVCSNDVRRDPRWYDEVDAEVDGVTGAETRSLLCVPLRHRGRITGVVEVINKRRGEFNEADLRLLEAVSSIAAATLENARLYAAMRSYADELALMHQIGLTLSSTLDFSLVVDAALTQVERLFLADSVSFLRTDPETGELVFVQSLASGNAGAAPFTVVSDGSIAGWVMAHGRPVLIDDVSEDERWSAQDERHLGELTRALMAVPLMTSERTIGVIIVTNVQAAMYTRDELCTLQTLASTLSVALENARLYDDLKRLLREREQAQERLIRSEKMAALGRLVASITHEINNPLQAMQTYLTLAEENLADQEKAAELQRYIGIVGSEVDRISTIVRRLRDFYRPDQVEVQRLEVHDVLESVLELTHKQLQYNEVTVKLDWAGDLPPIDANPDRLKQVFLNLVLNAVDAMPQGGILSISTARDAICLGPDELEKPAVRIEFSDTGKGIPQEILSRLFEPFFTVKEQGVGLGLSISYAIVRAHGGQISVESHVGLGSVFTILLPIRQSGTVVIESWDGSSAFDSRGNGK